MIVGAFSSLERRVGAKIKKRSRMEERVAPAQEEWQQIIIIKKKYMYIYIYFRLVRPTIWHKNTKKAIPGLETTLVCQLSLNDTTTVKDLLANKFLPFTFE